jgi:nucleoside-diphosphate-sugar epimerase
MVSRGHEVWALRRCTRGLAPCLHAVEADITVPESLRGLPEPLDHVVVCAAPDRGDDDGYRSVYVDGLSNLLGAVVLTPQSRVLFTSSTAVYEQQDGVWVDESSPATPQHFRGKRLLEAESLLLGCAATGVVVRFGGIYGPGRARLLDAVARAEATYSVGEPVYTNRVHLFDCAGILEHLLQVPQPERIYVGVDDEPVSRAVLLGWLASRLGVPPPRAIPPSAARTQSGGANKRCSNRLLRASGYNFVMPSFRDGYEGLIAQRRTSP